MAINSGNTLSQAKISLAVEGRESSSEHFVHWQCQDLICIYTFTHTGGWFIEEHPASVFLWTAFRFCMWGSVNTTQQPQIFFHQITICVLFSLTAYVLPPTRPRLLIYSVLLSSIICLIMKASNSSFYCAVVTAFTAAHCLKHILYIILTSHDPSSECDESVGGKTIFWLSLPILSLKMLTSWNDSGIEN